MKNDTMPIKDSGVGVSIGFHGDKHQEGSVMMQCLGSTAVGFSQVTDIPSEPQLSEYSINRLLI